MKIATLLVTLIASVIIVPMISKMLVMHDYIRDNYKKEKIPNSMGLVYMISIVALYFVVSFDKNFNAITLSFYLAGIIIMGLIGFLDDSIGNTTVKGFKGHIKMLLKGTLTTGGLKALTGGAIALIISINVSYNIVDIILNTIIIALFTNFQNLLDLRPGRASKVFTFLLMITYGFLPYKFQLLSIAFFVTTLVYFPLDIKAKGMLGDTGANMQGIVLGILFIKFSFITRIITVILLIAINYYAEKKSITTAIQNNRFLNYIDMLGRDK